MLPGTVTSVFRALAVYPLGGTAKQVAAELGWTRTITSQRLGELFFSGDLERENIAAPGPAEYRYRRKPARVDSPASQWQPEVWLAERARRDRETSS